MTFLIVAIACLLLSVLLAFLCMEFADWQSKRLRNDIKKQVNANVRLSEEMKETLNWEIDQSFRRNRLL